jgi:hypothetical protein
MKAYIGAGVAGALALAGVIAVSARSSAPVQAAPDRTQGASLLQGSEPAGQQPILVNCGEGRQAMVRQTLVGDRTVSRVECVPDASLMTDTAALPGALNVPGQFGAQQFQAPAPAPVAPAAQTRTRVVYRDRPVYRERAPERPVYTASNDNDSAPAASSGTRSGSGDYGRSSEPARRPGRSWRKSAVIIGGTAAGGAGVGAILGGRRGAAKGAVLGGVAGTIYDIATRNKDTH